MAGKPRDVTDAELDVLQVLWDRGPLTVRDVAAILDSARQDTYYSTVKKLLERLEAKGFVRRQPRGVAYAYEPAIGRDDLLGRRLREMSERLCDGSVTPLLTLLASDERLTKKQQETLLNLIDELTLDDAKQAKANRRRK